MAPMFSPEFNAIALRRHRGYATFHPLLRNFLTLF